MQLGFDFGCPTTALHGDADRTSLGLVNELIEGPGKECWVAGLEPLEAGGRLNLWRSGSEVWGVGLAAVTGPGFDTAAETLYRELFQATGDLMLQRVWNFVPRINEQDGDIENYRAFCRGRYAAFEAHFGDDSEPRMPAASAVGTGGDALAILFVAGTDRVTFVENPDQVPAYRYPASYGPRSPSFSRGSLVERAGRRRLYVSGTASIRRSESLNPGNVTAQFELALANVDRVARAAGLEQGLNSGGQRSFRLYVRRPQDWPAVREVFQRRLYREGDRFNVVQAEICRRELLVEIEACMDVDIQRAMRY